jgi:hypothetical protein
MKDNAISLENKQNRLTCRQRVLAALNHQAVDRVPVDLGGTHCSGAHVSVITQLRKALGLAKMDERVKVTDIYQAVGDKIHVVWMDGSDLSSQNSLFCSPDGYKELYLPYAKKVNDWIHANTKWKTIKHCCGGCEPLIDGFIDAGYDVLNPVQCSAAGMDPQHLVRTHPKT